VPPIRFHDLRHTNATHLLRQGIHPKVVSERLGHSSIGNTLDTYTHLLTDMQKEAAMKIDSALGGALREAKRRRD
jgi:integrase